MMKQALFFSLSILVLFTFSYCQSPRPPARTDPRELSGKLPLDLSLVHRSTADQSVEPDTSVFRFGVNPGWYGNGYTDQLLHRIASEAGVHSSRPGFSDNLASDFGYNCRIDAFRYYYDTLDIRENVVFLNGPSPDHRDTTHYCSNRSLTFAHLYDPVWNADSTVNPGNFYASYVYNVVKRYGPFVRFWEVWNEPDITNATTAYSLPGQSGNWFDNPPPVANLYGFYAPVWVYNRMLRITYTIVHRLYPWEYVCTGGLGYPSFLDAILRFTDNPDSGKVSPQYPLKGGAYFDVLSFHSYPQYRLHHWDNSIGGFAYQRTSDYACQAATLLKDAFQDVLDRYGYNGVRFPRKLFINTEINIPRRKFGEQIGSDLAQHNFMVKWLVKAQQEGILQVYIFALGEAQDPDKAKDVFGLMGLYENLTRDPYGQQKLTQEGVAVKTMSELTYGYRYDSSLTRRLRLPADVDGAAFSRDGHPIFILWARQLTDESEATNTQYHFPAEMGLGNLKEFLWDYAKTPGDTSTVQARSVELGGTPVFLFP